MKFSLIQPTFRNLPDGWRTAALDWFLKCDEQMDVEHILVTHQPHEENHVIFSNTRFVTNPVSGSVSSWNTGARIATGDFLIAMADDLMCCQSWDTKLSSLIWRHRKNGPKEPAVVEVEHEDQSILLTHPFVTRGYYEQFGYLFHPDYKHLMCDCEFTHVARTGGNLINARYLHFPHLGPLHPAARRLATHTPEQERELKEARELFKTRVLRNFPKESVLEVAC